ncbi:CG12446, partial [Drosophila busckii]
TLQQLLQRKAQQLGVEQVFWTQDLSGQQLQARLELRQDERYERLLAALAAWGIGERLGTQLTLLSCMETQQPKQQQQEQAQAPASSAGSWQSFMDSVRCRLNVNQVVRVVRRDATINFDFAVLLMAAALLSCIGLLENSFLFLSSSMLISPLMGPIIAAIFGHVVGDTQLRWLGIRNELIGIGIALGTGFVCGGAICCWRGLARYFVLSAGLTEEMFTRCETHSLAIGLGTALASGAAAAIGVLGGNTGSLVGVAISASLLPPAVNAGLLWALALGTLLLQLDEQLLVALSKRRIYSPQLPVELFLCAVVSMALALLNILCVWLMGVVVLRIKEVAPAMQRDEQFWRHDVRLARQVALRDPQLQCAIDRLDVDQQQEQQVPDAPHYHHTWSPGVRPIIPTTPTPTPTAKQHTQGPSSYHTVHGFQNFCLTLHQLNRSTPTTP